MSQDCLQNIHQANSGTSPGDEDGFGQVVSFFYSMHNNSLPSSHLSCCLFYDKM
jgi:hypothetical protein